MRGGDSHSAHFRQVEHASQVDVALAGVQGVAEQFLRRRTVMLGREAAQAHEIRTARLAAVRGDGKCQLGVFQIGGRDVRV